MCVCVCQGAVGPQGFAEGSRYLDVELGFRTGKVAGTQRGWQAAQGQAGFQSQGCVLKSGTRTADAAGSRGPTRVEGKTWQEAEGRKQQWCRCDQSRWLLSAPTPVSAL